MANKQDVNNAYYEGVCTILDSLMGVGGICFSTLPVNLRELRDYASKNDYETITEQCDNQIKYEFDRQMFEDENPYGILAKD